MKTIAMAALAATLLQPVPPPPGAPDDPVQRIVVVDERIDPGLREALDAEKAFEGLAKILEARGFRPHQAEGRRFYFAGPVWKEGATDVVPGLYREILARMDRDGFVKLDETPNLRRYLAGYQKNLGLSLPPGTEMAVAPYSYVWVSDGTTTKMVMHRPGLPPAVEKRLEAKHFVVEGNDGRSAAEVYGGNLPVLGSLEVWSRDRRSAALAPVRAQDLAEAAKILAERYRVADSEGRAFRRRMRELGYGIPNEAFSLKLDDRIEAAPPAVRNRAENELVGNWRQAGFASQAEAREFFGRARVVQTAHRWTVRVSVLNPQGIPGSQGIGLP